MNNVKPFTGLLFGFSWYYITYSPRIFLLFLFFLKENLSINIKKNPLTHSLLSKNITTYILVKQN